jgi:glucokinase
VLGQSLTLIDGLAVIGGGLSAAHAHFLPAVLAELNGHFRAPDGSRRARLGAVAFNLEDPAELDRFVAGDRSVLTVPGSGRTLAYDRSPRVGVGLSVLGTSQAIAIGAYRVAMQALGLDPGSSDGP